MRALPMTGATLTLPGTWAWIPVVTDASGWEREVAENLCDGKDNQKELAARLGQLPSVLVNDDTQSAAVCVPDRNSPEIVGAFLVRMILPDEGHEGQECSRAYYRSLIEPDPRTGRTVFSRSIDEVDVRAGPALRVREVAIQHEPEGSDEEEIVAASTSYIVFPPGSTDSLEVTFWTPSLEMGDYMATDGAEVVDTLEVTLGD